MKKALITMALLLVPFFSQANIFTDGTVTLQTPKQVEGYTYECKDSNGTFLGLVELQGVFNIETAMTACHPMQEEAVTSLTSSWSCPATGGAWANYSQYRVQKSLHWACNQQFTTVNFNMIGGANTPFLLEECPPDLNPSYTSTSSATGSMMCYDPSQAILVDSCNINDSPNVQVTSAEACYTKSDGSSCSVTAVDIGGGNQVYQGSEGNCYAEPNPDISGNPALGDTPIDDSCTNIGNSILACAEDPTNVCADSGSSYATGSVNNCQDGCGYINDAFLCYDTDTDLDGLPDYNDPDIDGDGIANGQDLDADGDGQDDPINEGTGSGQGTDLGPVVSEIKKTNTKLDDLLDQFKTDQQLEAFGSDGKMTEENTKYKASLDGLTSQTGVSLGYSESLNLANTGFASVVPVDGCRSYSIPVGFFGNFNIDLCEVSQKVKPVLSFVFGFLAAFYVFITVNTTLRGAT